MARTRKAFVPSHAEFTERSKRQKNGPSAESSRPATTNTFDVTADPPPSRGNRASYHCDYCHKDITGVARIKCAACVDFDLCVECFSVGVEIHPHKSNHPYRVMESLSFPLFTPDWSAEDETLLLEGLGIYGPSNWEEVAVHVSTKTKEECHTHYTEIYLNYPNFLPDMSRIRVDPKEQGANKQDAEQGTCPVAAAAAANENEAVPNNPDKKAPGKDSDEAAPGK